MTIENIEIIEKTLQFLFNSANQSYERTIGDIITDNSNFGKIYEDGRNISVINFLESENLCVYKSWKEPKTGDHLYHSLLITQKGKYIISKYGTYYKYIKETKRKNIINTVVIILTVLGAISAIYSAIYLFTTNNQNKIDNTKNTQQQNTNIKPQTPFKSNTSITIKSDSLKKAK